MSNISLKTIEWMLEKAVNDGLVSCPKCEYEPLEPDYNKCPECKKDNPLRKGGFI